MKDVYIVSAVRTAVGVFGGTLRQVKAYHLGAAVIREAIARVGIEAGQVDGVIMGEVRQTTEASNMARLAALAGGVPEHVQASTTHRNCASSMQALYQGRHEIMAGEGDIYVVGGAENMSRSPYYIRNARFGDGAVEFSDANLEGGPNSQPQEMYGSDLSMGMTAEIVAEEFGIDREAQDRFALLSQQKAASAIAEGRFKKEIVPFEVKGRKQNIIFDQDEGPRPNTTLEGLQKLKPVFKQGGSVTAGNCCGRNDGGAAMVIMSGEKVAELGIKPMARVVGITVTGLSPRIMGVGPISAVNKLLQKTGLTMDQIDLVELNEAFASQALAVIRELGFDLEKTNVNGGGIALGHPMGATGARLITTLVHELERRGGRYGIATLCIGGGMGMATLVERV